MSLNRYVYLYYIYALFCIHNVPILCQAGDGLPLLGPVLVTLSPRTPCRVTLTHSIPPFSPELSCSHPPLSLLPTYPLFPAHLPNPACLSATIMPYHYQNNRGAAQPPELTHYVRPGKLVERESAGKDGRKETTRLQFFCVILKNGNI